MRPTHPKILRRWVRKAVGGGWVKPEAAASPAALVGESRATVLPGASQRRAAPNSVQLDYWSPEEVLWDALQHQRLYCGDLVALLERAGLSHGAANMRVSRFTKDGTERGLLLRQREHVGRVPYSWYSIVS